MSFTRRQFLATAGLAALGQGCASPSASAAAESFDFAFLTDMHVQPERGAADGLRLCVRSVNALAKRPDFAITGGDLVMDALDVGLERSRMEFGLFDECMRGLELPVHHTLGNHDVVGWSAKGLVPDAHHDYGKKLFAERYGRGRTYRSFSHRGWHFVLLDSVGYDAATRSYRGWIDEEQLAWLRADLAGPGLGMPTVIVTHIPFYSVWHQVHSGPATRLDAKALVGNVHEFRKLFDQHDIRLVLSGHGHVVERIEIGRIAYIQGGAVSGMWWKGPVFGKPEGYGVVTCRSDGTFDWNYRDYGWKARS